MGRLEYYLFDRLMENGAVLTALLQMVRGY